MAAQARFPNEPIAIVGSSCRFPGHASSPSQLWELFHQPQDVASEIPRARFDVDKFYHPDPSHPGTSNGKSSKQIAAVRHSYVLAEDHRVFDAGFFGINPVEASAIDPQQRILLESAYEALESAGMSLKAVQDSDMGVYVGLMNEDYSTLGRDIQQVPNYLASGTARNNMSNRISYFFNLHGPSVTIDTACSSSLVALHQAVQSLRSGECSVALVGGANLLLAPEPYISMSKMKMLSPSGRCRMWDKDCDGYARGDGFAVIIAKPLSKALENRDNIEYVVRETAVNQDGRTRGITMPSAIAQANLIRATYAKAGLDLSKKHDRPQYFEAHGTGTITGDPLEAQAISDAFFSPDQMSEFGPDPLYIGSAKTIIGHTEGTAGLAGLMRASLAMQHGIIPPNMHLKEINPAVKRFCKNLEITRAALHWPEVPAQCPRRASINSFGFGGTNAHAIIETFEHVQRRDNDGPMLPMMPFNFSASSEKSLAQNLSQFARFVRESRYLSLRDLSWTLDARRSTLPIRVSITAANSQELEYKVEEHASKYSMESARDQSVISTLPIDINSPKVEDSPRILGLFTGQGAQWALMGAELISASPVASACIDRLQESLDSLPPGQKPCWSLREELLRKSSDSRVNVASFSQPLCTAVQIMLLELLNLAELKLSVLVGHSSGEIAAAFAAGHVSEGDAIRIAYFRGLFIDLASEGAMLAVTTTHEDAQELCGLPSMRGRICVAAYNSPTSVTLSGDITAIKDAEEIFSDEKKWFRRLRVDKAYHSPHMQACADAYADSLRDCAIHVRGGDNTGPGQRGHPIWISSVTGQNIETMDPFEMGASYWVKNMVQPVLFTQAIEVAIGAHGTYDMAIEIGPHPALKGPFLESLKRWGARIPHISTLARGKTGIESIVDTLGSVWTHLGDGAINFDAFDNAVYGVNAGCASLIKGLPPYSWLHDRIFYHETRSGQAFRSSPSIPLWRANISKRPHSLLGTLCADETVNEFRFKNYLRSQEFPWLSNHQINGQIVFPAAGYVSAVVEAIQYLFADEDLSLLEVSDLVIGRGLILPSKDDSRGVETLLSLKVVEEEGAHFELIFSFFSADSLSHYKRPYEDTNPTIMSENASGKIRVVKSLSTDCSLPQPCNDDQDTRFLPIEPSSFYDSAAQLGYGYHEEFQGLTEIWRKLNQATGSIQVPLQGRFDPLTIHPAILDCAIQAVLLAYSYPGDGRLRRLHVPTRISRIDIDLPACRESANKDTLVRFKAFVMPKGASATDHGLDGDVDIQTEDRGRTMIQLQGLTAVSYAPPSAENDTHLFFEMTWGPETYSADMAWSSSAKSILPTCSISRDLAVLADRLACYFMRQVSIHRDDVGSLQLSEKQKSLLEFCRRRLSMPAGDTGSNADSVWSSDSKDDVVNAIQQHASHPDLELIDAAGHAVVQSVQEGPSADIRRTMAKRVDIFRGLASNSVSISLHIEGLSNVLKQLAHRFSHLRVLEITGKTGIAPAGPSVLSRIAGDIASYTIAYPNDEIMRQMQHDPLPGLMSLVLDVEREITNPTLQEDLYDIMIVSDPFQAGHLETLDVALHNMRRLIRAGGFLILLDAIDNDSPRAGLISALSFSARLDLDQDTPDRPFLHDPREGLEYRLHRAGFSAIDQIFHPQRSSLVLPLSISITQAVDEQLTFLREPLASNAGSLGLDTLTIVCADHEKCHRLHGMVRQHFKHVQFFNMLQDFTRADFPVGGTMVHMADEEALSRVFEPLTPATVDLFRQMFKRSSVILWSTSGTHSSKPYATLFKGLQRVVSLELSDVNIQTIDFASDAEVDVHLVARKLLQLAASCTWHKDEQLKNKLWCNEPELKVRDRQVLIPRLRQSAERNRRYNSTQRYLTEEIDVENVQLSVGPMHHHHHFPEAHNGHFAFSVAQQCGGLSEVSGIEHNVRLTHSYLKPISITKDDVCFLSLAKLTDDSSRIFVLTDSLASQVDVLPSWTLPAPSSLPDALAGIACLHAELLARIIVENQSRGGSLGVLNPWSLLGRALVRLAATERMGHAPILITTSPNNSPTPPWVHIHPNETERSIKLYLPTDLSTLVDMGDGESRASTSLERCLPSTCRRVKRCHLMHDYAQMDSSPAGVRRIGDYFQAAWLGSQSLSKSLSKDPVPFQKPLGLNDLRAVTGRGLSSSVYQTLFTWGGSTKLAVPVRPASELVSFPGDKTYWLVGLTGGLGLSLCEWMADRGARFFVLSSRNPRTDQLWIRNMSQRGCTVMIVANDISDRQSVQRLHDKILKSMPPIAGVAQGAMVLHDAVFLDLDAEHLNNVLRPKVDGSIYLDELFSLDTLNFLVFFSSMAYVVGNKGQSAYSMANAFMAGLAASRRQRGLAASVINIGGVLGEGYVSRQLKNEHQQLLLRAGVDFISESAFHELFAEGILASRADPSVFLDACEISTGLRVDDRLEGKTFASNPIFQHLVPRARGNSLPHPGGSRRNFKATNEMLAEATTENEVYDIVKEGLLEKLEISLHLDKEQTNLLRSSPAQIGVDSLVAVAIQEWFFKELHVEFSVMKILNASSMAQLVRSAQESIAADMVPKVSAAASPATSGNRVGIWSHETNKDIVNVSSLPHSLTTGPAIPAFEAPATIDAPAERKQFGARAAGGTPLSASNTTQQRDVFDVDEENHHDSGLSGSLETGIWTATSSMPSCEHLDSDQFYRVLPMSFAQTRFWFLKHLVEDQTAFNVTTVVHLKGRVDSTRLSRALTAVGTRHEAIRTAFFTNESDSYMQGVLPSLPSQLEEVKIANAANVQGEIRDIQEHEFDLSRGESIRLKLVSLREKEHWLVLGYHHIAVDGIGNRIFLSDLERAYYNTLDANDDSVLQYPDFSIRQRQEYEQGAWSKQIGKWRAQFPDLPPPLPVLHLAGRESRPLRSVFSSHSAKLVLEPELKRSIAQCCRRLGVTPFHFYLTVFGVLLFRQTNMQASDLCIGVADGNRKDSDVVRSLGLFLNILPLRFCHRPDELFADTLRNVREKTDVAYANSRVPIDVLLEDLKVPRVLSHSPLFQAFFNYRQNVQDSGKYLGCEAAGELISGGENAYDISIDVLDSASRENTISVSVNSGIYTRQHAEVLKDSYLNLLGCFGRNPALRISGCPLYLSDKVEEAICHGKGQVQLSTWSGTIVDRIDEMTSLYQGKVALTDGSRLSLTYGDMASRASEIAARLSVHGIGPGACVGIYQTPGPDWICSLLGVLRTAASCVPLDIAVGPARLLVTIQDCQAQIILIDATTASHSDFLSGIASRIEDVSKLSLQSVSGKERGASNFKSRARPDGAAFITYTSGSTGTPKGVVIKHSSYMNFVEHGPPIWGISENYEVILQQSSWAFDMSLCQTLVCLGWGGTLVVPDLSVRGDPAAICQLIVSQRITFTLATPTEYLAWMRHGFAHTTNMTKNSSAIERAQWRGAMSGGEPVTAGLLQAFSASVRPGFRFINCYGPCETTFACAECIQFFPLDTSQSLGSKDGVTAVGTALDTLSPLPNCFICIVDHELKPVPAGVVGQVMIGGAGVAEGYLRQPLLTRDVFLHDVASHTFLKDQCRSKAHLSGDLGWLDSNGRLVLQGRVDGSTQVKVGGIRMDLEDIESAMVRVMETCISQVVVSCRKGPDSSNDLLVAFVVFTPGAVKSQDKPGFLSELPHRLALPKYMRPSLVLELLEIPWTLSNKVDRAAVDMIPLPQPLSPTTAITSLARDGIDKIGHTLRQLWLEVLPGAGIWQNEPAEGSVDFFHVGGSSLSLIRLQSLIRKRLDIALSIEQLFRASRLDMMTALVRESASETGNDKHCETNTLEVEAWDWGNEVEIPPGLTQIRVTSSKRTIPPRVLVLTGATGLLGQDILRQLIELAHVTKIYCLAIRKSREQLMDMPIFSHTKVVACPGDLSASRLGLSEPSAHTIFDEADAVIHAGADVSFLKTYTSLRPTNVFSTKELARLSLPRRLPFHFISSASVMRLSGVDEMGPVSVAGFPPSRPSTSVSSDCQTTPPNNSRASDGYNESKWVSEVFLENVAHDPNLRLPVVIHRPSSIIGAGPNDLDLMSSLRHYAQITATVPDTSAWKGQLDFVSLQMAAETILEHVMMTDASWSERSGGDGTPGPNVRFVYESGEVTLSFSQLRTHLENSTGKSVTVLPFMRWVEVLEKAGMSGLLATYLRQLVSDGQLSLPRLSREGT